MNSSLQTFKTTLAAAAGLIGASLATLSCGGDNVPAGVPDCRILARSLDFGQVVRPQGDLPNSVVSLPVSIRSVLTVRTVGGQENIPGKVSFWLTSEHPVAPQFRIPEAEDGANFVLEPESTLVYTLEATVTGDVTPGTHTGVLDFGMACGNVPVRIDVLGWDEDPPRFVSMWGDQGSEFGEFESPSALAVDSQGRVYVVDPGNNRVQIFDPDGKFLRVWRSLDEQPLFRELSGIAIDEHDVVYVADLGFEFPRISLFNTNGTRIEVWDRANRFPLVAAPGRLAVHDRIAYWVDPQIGNVTVLTGDFTTIGVDILTRIGQRGDGHADFGEPRGVAVEGNGRVFVTDIDKHAVFVFTEEGEFLYRFGQEGDLPGFFNRPAGILYGPDGFLYVVDEENVRVQKFSTEGVFQSLWGHPGYLEGAFFHPLDVAFGPDGSIYVVEEGHHRIQRFRYAEP